MTDKLNKLNVADFRRQNPIDWKALLEGLFPFGQPRRAVWEDAAAIHAVLTHLCSRPDVHYTFLPSGGGLDLHGAKAGPEPGMTELLFSEPWLASVRSLSFESFGDGPEYYPWAYFRIDLNEVPSVGVNTGSRPAFMQRLTEFAPGDYRPRERWDERFEEGCELPADVRPVVLALKGTLVLFTKVSIYNLLGEAAFAPQQGLSADEFRARVGRMREASYTMPQEMVTKELLGQILLGKEASSAL